MLTKFTYFSKIHSKQSTNYFINEKEKVRIKKLKNPKAFIDCSQTIDDVYKNLIDYNPTKKKNSL